MFLTVLLVLLVRTELKPHLGHKSDRVLENIQSFERHNKTSQEVVLARISDGTRALVVGVSG